jgi:adenosine deaminase
MRKFIHSLPKVELHLHIEGTLEPELMFALAKRNHISIPFNSYEEVSAAYNFHNLQSFLDIYYQGAKVLINEQDFFELTWAYLLRCQTDNVVHTEIFFDPQTHTDRGIAFDTVINGIHRALVKAEVELGISSNVIMCFLRHLDEASAFNTLTQALVHKDKIVAVGLDSSELGNPVEKFARVFQKAIAHGFKAVAHAGEEGPASNIVNALNVLQVNRIDHGVRCSDDKHLVAKLAADKTPLTVCPLSNTKLKVFQHMSQHNIVALLRQGVCVTINSDDPAYFGGQLNENFAVLTEALDLDKNTLFQLAKNSIVYSLLDSDRKTALVNELETFYSPL